MNFQQLITFLEVAKRRHFRKAAEHLLLTQPAVSAQIRGLEEELGVPLIQRNPFALTPAGKAFIPYAKQILALTEEGKRAALDSGNSLPEEVTVAISSGVALPILSRLLKYFRQEHPRARITIRTKKRSELIRGLREGEVDVGIVCGIPESRHIRSRVIHYDTLTLVAPADHPVARVPYFPLERLADIPLLSLSADTEEQQLISRLLGARGIDPPVAVELRSVEEILRMVTLGFGPALVPKLALQGAENSGIREVRIAGLEVQWPVTLVVPLQRILSPGFRQLMDDICGIYPSEPEE
ncbi:MAG: LysR family transcriptional regulator [Planifilum fulgidum]